MAIRYPLVIMADGQIGELPAGDSLPATQLGLGYAAGVIYDESLTKLGSVS